MMAEITTKYRCQIYVDEWTSSQKRNLDNVNENQKPRQRAWSTEKAMRCFQRIKGKNLKQSSRTAVSQITLTFVRAGWDQEPRKLLVLPSFVCVKARLQKVIWPCG